MKKHVLQVIWGVALLCCLAGFWPGAATGQTPSAKSAQAVSKEKPSTSGKKQGGPIVITGDNLEIDSERKIATYTGNVKVVQGSTSMFSDTLVIYLDTTGKKLEKAEATGNVRLVNESITATGEKGIFYNQDQKLELIGQAKVWQENNTITAHRILAFLEEEIVEGYSEADTERAIMTVYSKEALTPGENPEESTAPETAASPETLSESAPIVIVSDRLKLDNTAGLATYFGDVIATKETTEIRADEMLVYLDSAENAENDIEKIEVNGHVQITRETTTVRGEKGIYFNQEQHAIVEGGTDSKAFAEDKVQNMVLEAPIIEAFLATNTIKARGATSTVEEQGAGSRIRTFFGDEEDDGSSETQEPSPDSETRDREEKEDLPSVTLFPGKK